MSFKQSPTNSWGQPAQELAPAISRSRFQEARGAIGNPELQEKAKRFGQEVGSAALLGAAENAGIVNVEDDGSVSVRKRGILKAALMPKRAARKAAVGALRGAHEEAKGQATTYARGRVNEAMDSTPQPAWGVTPSAPASPADGAWGSPSAPTTETAPSWGAPQEQPAVQWVAPVPPASTESWWDKASTTPANPNAAPLWGAQEQATPYVPPAPQENISDWGGTRR